MEKRLEGTAVAYHTIVPAEDAAIWRQALATVLTMVQAQLLHAGNHTTDLMFIKNMRMYADSMEKLLEYKPEPVCIPKAGIPASIEEAADGLYRKALDAVAHVGAANYQSGQNAAEKWVSDAYDKLQDALDVYRHASKKET